MNMKYLLKSGTVLLTSLFLAASPLSHAGNRSCKAASGGIRQEIAANPELAAGLFNPYPDHNIGIISDAPKGYRPFYISHYGRHGSRWLANDREYSNVTKPLERAAKAGKLTDKGRKLLERVMLAREQARGIEGCLSPLGTLQHRGIAERTFANYPDVFANRAEIDARSTMTVRCVMSMNAFCLRLKELNPDLEIGFEASDRNTAILAHVYGAANEVDPAYKDYCRNGEYLRRAHAIVREKMGSEDFLDSLFTDYVFKNKEEEMNFIFYLFYLVSDQKNVMPENRMWDIYTPDQLYWMTVAENFRGIAKFGGHQGCEKWTLAYAVPLLEDIVGRCDNAVAGNGRAADLRFGHDVVLMALVPLMCLDGYDKVPDDPEKLLAAWNLYDITPMAANMQMVFYRPVRKNDGEVLVKILLNEHEVTLPLKNHNGKYYRWNDVRKLLNDRIKKYKTKTERTK